MSELKLDKNRIRSAYLLLGQEEEKLDALANQFAISILSEGTHFQEKGFATKEQYRENIALRVKKREHPDCILVDFQDKPGGGKKSSIGVNQIREEVKGTADISPKEGEYKLYFLKHSDKMTVEAQNAILKTLEEAPDHVIILLFAQNETKLLPTVLSRVVKIFAGEMDTARRVQAFSEDPVLSRLLPFLKDIPYKKQGEMQDFADELGTVDSADLFCFLDIILRDVLCYKCTKSVDQLYEKEASPYLLEMAKRYSFSLLGKWSAYMERYRMGKTYNVQSPLQILDLFFLLHEEG
jgi:DNA polymerase III, gamma/tau subunits